MNPVLKAFWEGNHPQFILFWLFLTKVSVLEIFCTYEYLSVVEEKTLFNLIKSTTDLEGNQLNRKIQCLHP